MLKQGPYDPQKTEPEILKFWLDGKFFKPEYDAEKGLLTTEEMRNDDRESFCIVNPPPNAYMRPHIGNVSGYAYQDVFLRYNRMKGKKVLGQPGKDHAGIQGEVVLEKIFMENKKKTKQEMGREKFYMSAYSHFQKLMPMVMADEQRIGLSSDYDRNLFTLDPKIVQTVLGTFTKMFADKMVYKGVRIVNWDPVAKTTLADIDTERVERETELVYIKYPLAKKENLSNIKIIVFDLSHVLFQTGKAKYDALAEKLGIKDSSELRDMMHEEINPKAAALREGKMSTKEFWQDIAQHFNVNSFDPVQLDEIWFSRYTFDEKLFTYIKELKAKGYKLGILSNTLKERIASHDEKFNFLEAFDYAYFSYEHGLIKPNPEIYLDYCKTFNCNSEEILFVDDKQENLDPAAELGWKTFLYNTNPDALKDFISTGQKFITVATTRAETMLGDTAVIVNPADERYTNLIGEKVVLPLVNREIPIISSARVEMEFGTGAVKLTPAHSYDDYVMMNEWNTAQKDENKKVGYINIINKQAKMDGPIPEKYKGLKTDEARKVVEQDLEELGLIVKREPHKQAVMVGERSKAVIEQIMSSQWFIDVEKLKGPAIDAVKNGEVKIHPDYMVKKYLNWMENLHDWPVSRSLWWGYRIPVWYKGEVQEMIDEKTGQIIETIHGMKVDGIYDAVEKGLAKVQIEDPNVIINQNDSEKTDINLTFMRHGETDYNIEKRFSGWASISINNNGKKQALEAAEKLTNEHYDLIITSDLKRARDTAEIIAEKLNLSVKIDPRVKERHFGVLDEMTWTEFSAQYPEVAVKNHENYQTDLVDGEAIQEVETRVKSFIDDLKKNYKGKKVLLVTHTGVTRILRRILLGTGVEDTREHDLGNCETVHIKINTSEWIQDNDVFDTWFSSGQWAYATLIANDLMDTFYPSDIMETAYDILELWVSRMIMLGLYTQGKIPFKNVYLHGMVKAADGQKMSKSKGNVISPDEIISKYGADSLRLMYIVGNKAGAGYPVSYEKLEGYKRFLNKIWNASKFVLSNIEGLEMDEQMNSENSTYGPAVTNEQDKNLLNSLDQLTKDVTRHIDNFRIGMGAELIYQDFWHNFCDIYLEQVKSRLYTKDKEGNPINTSDEAKLSRKEAQSTLLFALRTYLKLLHPFVPFITETIWTEIPKVQDESNTIMYANWPE